MLTLRLFRGGAVGSLPLFRHEIDRGDIHIGVVYILPVEADIADYDASYLVAVGVTVIHGAESKTVSDPQGEAVAVRLAASYRKGIGRPVDLGMDGGDVEGVYRH